MLPARKKPAVWLVNRRLPSSDLGELGAGQTSIQGVLRLFQLVPDLLASSDPPCDALPSDTT
jgi:hypothetical protein